MKFALIVCTYNRPGPLLRLLKSVVKQTAYPEQIVVIDGSVNTKCLDLLEGHSFDNLEYYRVEEKDRGLTRQRNFGISRIHESLDVVCFLDDDIVLTPNYFENLLRTYQEFPDAIGVGGYIIDDVEWKKVEGNKKNREYYQIDGYIRKDSSRFLLRKKFGLMPSHFPTFMPPEGHGRSVGFLPPSGKIYRVETFMGGVSSYRKEILDKITFSTFFQGYGLYEDTDFTLRLSQLGNLYINTSAKLYHYHEEGGRPNRFNYGKMVVRNGWYVWRVKHPKPKLISRIKWHLITWLLIMIRLSNVVSTPNRREALTETLGRILGWGSVIFNKPKGSIK